MKKYSSNPPGVDEVFKLVTEVYVPFAEIQRTIVWPTHSGSEPKFEDDAQHSFSLAMVGIALASRLGLNAERVAFYATVHDLPEVFAGDTNIWDTESVKTKHTREMAAIKKFEKDYNFAPALAQGMHDYEAQKDEESRFVYALDKLLALMLVMYSGGKYWLENRTTYQMHLDMIKVLRPKVAAHPVVLGWYDVLLAEVDSSKGKYFTTNSK